MRFETRSLRRSERTTQTHRNHQIPTTLNETPHFSSSANVEMFRQVNLEGRPTTYRPVITIPITGARGIDPQPNLFILTGEDARMNNKTGFIHQASTEVIWRLIRDVAKTDPDVLADIVSKLQP